MQRLANVSSRRCAVLLRAVLASALASVLGAQAFAQSAFPARAVRIIVPFAPGGSADTLARLVGQEIGKTFGQPVLVENRPGAGGMIGLDVVAKAPPDGHTLGLSATGALAINPSLYKSMPFDPQKDLAPVTLLATVPIVLVASNASGIKSMSELIAHSKAKPGSLSYGTTGTGSAMHLSGELLKMQTGVDMTHIPYKGSAPAVADAVAGQIPLAFVDLTSALPHIRAGRVQPLGTGGIRRTVSAPELATVAEGGVAGFDSGGWLGLVAPAGTPPEVIARLNAEARRIMNLPDIREKSIAVGCEPATGSPQEFAALIRAEIPKWAKAVALSGAKAE